MAIFSGIRNFVAALRVRLDNIVNLFLEEHGTSLGLVEHLAEKAPNLPRSEAQRLIDYTHRTRDFGERINRLSPVSRLLIGRAPVNPAYSGPPVYWTNVHWRDPQTGQMHEWLTIINAPETESREQAERRVRELALSQLRVTLPGGQAQEISPEDIARVEWLRGYRGV